MYIIYDLSNGDALDIKNGCKVYSWRFDKLEDARKFLKNAKRRKNSPEYSAIFEYGFSKCFVGNGTKAAYECLERV